MKFINDYQNYLKTLSTLDLRMYYIYVSNITSSDYYSDFYKRSFTLIINMIISELVLRNITV